MFATPSVLRLLRRTVLSLLLVSMVGLVAAPALAQQDTKIAVIDVERILTESNRGQRALSEINDLREAKRAEAQAMQNEVAQLRQQIQEGRLSLSQERIAELEQELERKAIAMQRFSDDAQRELTQKRNQVLEDIELSIFPVINTIGQEEGYTAIFNKFNSGLVFALDSIDITDRVIERYNAANPVEGTGGGSGGGSR